MIVRHRRAVFEDVLHTSSNHDPRKCTSSGGPTLGGSAAPQSNSIWSRISRPHLGSVGGPGRREPRLSAATRLCPRLPRERRVPPGGELLVPFSDSERHHACPQYPRFRSAAETRNRLPKTVPAPEALPISPSRPRNKAVPCSSRRRPDWLWDAIWLTDHARMCEKSSLRMPSSASLNRT
jgi:hypothetical protein